MQTPDTDKYVDPDPFTLISLVLSGAGLLLQFPQTYAFFKDKYDTSKPIEDKGQRDVRVTNLSDALDDASKYIDRVIRSVDKGASKPEEEFHEAKFGISLGIMKLELKHQRQFQRDLQRLYTKIGAMSAWTNQIIGSDDELASALGQRLSEKCDDAHKRLNDMMKSGATNRQILAEAKFIFMNMKACLSEVLISKN